MHSRIASEPPPPPLPRAEFTGTIRYELRTLLGAGAMGVVYEALDREHGNIVALKCLPSASPEAALRFKNEFRSLQGLHHQNLVKLGELVYEEEQLFFTMELVEGVDLISYCCAVEREPAARLPLSRSPTLGPDDATADDDSVPSSSLGSGARRAFIPPDEHRVRSAFAQLVRALLVLHAANKVHRDVKPSNVRVTPTGRVVLLDFGVVAELGSERNPADNRLVGTISYMSPEQAARGSIGPESDWYSVGVMLFNVLTGRFPFEGHAAEVLHRKQTETAPFARELLATIPVDLSDLCARLLDPDAGRRPSGEQILRTLEFTREASPSAWSREPLFVGRVPELLALHQAAQRARAGRVSVVHLEGPSGTGKTALLRRFLESTAEAGQALVLRGHCSEREYVPYRAVDGAVDSLADFLTSSQEPEIRAILEEHVGDLMQAFPVFGRLPGYPLGHADSGSNDPHVRRFRLFRALRALLSSLRAHKFVVLALDDMQWADADSIALLSAIVRSPNAPAVLTIVASRPHWSGRGVLRTWGAETVRLANLSQPEAVELALRLLGQSGVEKRVADDLAPQIASDARGHPLFIDELVRQTTHASAPVYAPELLDTALWSRIMALPLYAQALVKVAALAGSALPYRVLARAAGRPNFDDPISLSELATLRNEHLLQFTGSSRSNDVEIYHDRVASAVRSRLPEAERRELHRVLATALEADPLRDPEELAVHWQGAGDPLRASRHALTAAARADLALAFERAARLYQMAIECWPEHPNAPQIREQLGDALANAGLGAAAARAYLEASQSVTETHRFDLQRRAADQLFRAGHIDEAEPLIRCVLKHMGISLPTSTFLILLFLLVSRIRLSLTRFRTMRSEPGPSDENQIAELNACWSVAVGLSMVSNIRGACLQSRHLLLALRVRKPLPLIRALAAEASYVAIAGQRVQARAERILLQAETLAAGSDDPYARGFTTLSKAICCFLVGNWARAREFARVAERVFEIRPAGAMWELASARTFGLWSKFYLGDIAAMRLHVSDFIQEAETRGDRYASTLHRTGLVAMIWLASDEPGEARHHVLEAETGWSRSTFDFQRYLNTLGHCLIDLYEGAPELAYRRITEIWPQLRRSLYLRVQNLRFEALYLRGIAAIGAAAAAGDPSTLLRDAEHCARRIERERAGWAQALAFILLGGVSELRGATPVAIDHWQAAEAAARAHGMALFASAAAFRGALSIGGQAGASSIQQLRSGAALQDIREPDRVYALIAPGIPLHQLTVPQSG